NQNDVVPIGFNNFPELTYGINGFLSYKGFEMSVLFQGAGNYYALMREMTAVAFEWEWRATLADHLERWSLDRFENGDPISRPRLSQAGNLSPNAEPSDYWLMNSQYLRLKNVEIAYTFSGKDFLKRYGLNYLRIFAN